MKTTLKTLIALLTLVAFTSTQAAVTGRSSDSSIAGTEKLLSDSSGVDTYILVSTLLGGQVLTPTSVNGLTITTTTGTLTIPSGVVFTGPSASGTAATLAGTETLTNKTINLTSNTLTATSLQLKTALSDETGSGAAVFATSPTLVTPVLGAATATSVNGLTITASTGTLTVPDGVTLTGPAANGTAATLAGTETLTNKTINLTSNTLTATSAQLITAITNETGTGVAVFSTSPTLVTPVLGVATATSINGLTITASTGTLTVPDGVTLTGPAASGTAATLAGTETLTNKTMALGSNTISGTSAELRTALSDESGTGVAIFGTSATITTPVLSGTVTGTYTLAGTPTITSPTITGAKVTPNVQTITGDGAITVQSGVVLLTKGSAAAVTLAAPSSQDGTIIEITSTTDFAHVVTVTGGLWDGTATTNTTITFPVVAGGAVRIIAFGTDWYVLSNQGTTIAP